jgi:hypothetical protein
MLRFLIATAAAVAAAAALAGCGESKDAKPAPVASGEQRAVLGTIDALQSASRQGDADKICDEIFTETLAKSIRDASKRSCEKEVQRTLISPDAQISVGRQIDIKGSRATAMVREQNGNTSTVFLVKDGDRWRIERIKPVTQ